MSNSIRKYVDQAKVILQEIGVVSNAAGDAWVFTDYDTPRYADIRHSATPAAVAALATVNLEVARIRFPGLLLSDLMHIVPSMDLAEATAMAMVCGVSAPIVESQEQRAHVFGKVVWQVIEAYGLDGCFMWVPQRDSGQPEHMYLRPRGCDWERDYSEIPADLKKMRQCYRAMTPLQQLMTLSILHLYLTRKDTVFLLGGCPTKLLAVDALEQLQDNPVAMAYWASMVSSYAYW
ncbi:TPA: hypothetical protein NIA45_004798 [Pseudomonas aeruginosa]|nr:hypothetical protein [Pseudomonas aeruginosa]